MNLVHLKSSLEHCWEEGAFHITKRALLAIVQCVRTLWFSLFVDLVVMVNAIMVGVEVDHGTAGLKLPRLCLCCFYGVEIFMRALDEPCPSCSGLGLGNLRPWWRAWANLFDFVIVVLLATDVARGQWTWLWRTSIFRVLRYVRVYQATHWWSIFSDLWAVRAGLFKAWRALAWLALLLSVVLYACGAAAKGLVDVDADYVDELDSNCAGLNIRECFNVREYFGTTFRSALTMLQLATLDGWASRVVRPLSYPRPFVALLLTCVVCTVAYALLNMAVGVLVWSTVEAARSRGSQSLLAAMREDARIIELLGERLEQSLIVDNRTTLDLTELQVAMHLPDVADGLKSLDLPVSDIKQLFLHLDRHRRGEITVEEFKEGLHRMKDPATRFDIACLSATIGGSVSFTERLEERAQRTCSSFQRLKATMQGAFADLEQLHLPGGALSEMPELLLRKEGRIEGIIAVTTPRYS